MEQHYCMCMNEAIGDCHPARIDEDIWTQVAEHGPGNQKGSSIPNRTIIYRLHGPGGPFLVVLNALWVQGPDAPAIQAIRDLSAELDAPVRFILTPGSMHNLNLATYAEAFPDARVCIPRGRIPRAAPHLLQVPNVELYPVDQPPPELAEAGLEVLVFQGLVEGPGTAMFAKMEGRFRHVCESVEPQIFLHVPTGTITNGGHHMWYRHDEAPLMDVGAVMGFVMTRLLGLNFDLPPGKLSLEVNGAFAIADHAAVKASAERVLSWEFDRMIDIHARPGDLVMTGARALWEEALGPVVRGAWDEVAWKPAVPDSRPLSTITSEFRLEGTREAFWDMLWDYDQPLPGLNAAVELLKPGIHDERGVGSMRAIVVDGRPPLVEEVVEVVPLRSMAYRIYSGGPYHYYKGRMELAQDGPEVVLRYRAEVIPKVPGSLPFLRLMFWFMGRRVQSAWGQALKDRAARLPDHLAQPAK